MKLNTSNPGKLEEFKKLFGYELKSTSIDLREINSDPESVVAYKAKMAGKGVLIEDTSLDVEGEDVGINIKWLMSHLKEFIGKKAVWTVLLAMQEDDSILLWKGEVNGVLVSPRGKAFGFDHYFIPDGREQTLGESKTNDVSARAVAVSNFKNGVVFKTLGIPEEWAGEWQD